MKASDFGAPAHEYAGKFLHSRVEGIFHGPGFDTEEEAVAEAVGQMVEDDRGYAAVGKGSEIDLQFSLAEGVIEQLVESAYEQCGEVAEDYLHKLPKEVKADLEARLEKAVGEWLTAHDLWLTFCSVDTVRELSRADMPATP